MGILEKISEYFILGNMFSDGKLVWIFIDYTVWSEIIDISYIARVLKVTLILRLN